MKSKRIDKFLSNTSGALVGGTSEQPMMINAPLVIMFEQDGNIVCHLHPRPTDSYRGYGLLICDLVRHVAGAFKVDEDDVWEWVDKERHHHTTEITRPS